MPHGGLGGHVIRIYDDALWTKLLIRAAEHNVHVGVIAAAACLEYFDAHREPDPGIDAGTFRRKVVGKTVQRQQAQRVRTRDKKRMATAGLRPVTSAATAPDAPIVIPDPDPDVGF